MFSLRPDLFWTCPTHSYVLRVGSALSTLATVTVLLPGVWQCDHFVLTVRIIEETKMDGKRPSMLEKTPKHT